MFQEYPKSLHLNGEWEGDHIIVQGAEEEAQMRAKGYRMLGEPQKENEPKPRKSRSKE